MSDLLETLDHWTRCCNVVLRWLNLSSASSRWVRWNSTVWKQTEVSWNIMNVLVENSFIVWFFVTPSIQFLLSTVSFWDVSNYCPLRKVNEHNLNKFTNVAFYFIENVSASSPFSFFELKLKRVMLYTYTFLFDRNALNDFLLKSWFF